jgi:Na+/H+ antiporter NhaC
LAILTLDLLRFNVFIVIISGIIISGIIGILLIPSYSFLTLSKNIFDGYKSMGEILILSLLMGGFGTLIKSQGVFSLISETLERLVHSKDKVSVKLAEGAICAIASFFDICSANNTVAIILSGGVTRDIATRYNIPPGRTATLVDLFTCAFQGVLPYSAQVLLAGSIAGISPLAIIGNVHYCLLLGSMGVLAIVFQWPRSGGV